MKNICFILMTLTFLTSCQRDEKEIFIPKNYLEEFQTEKVQFFDLDTLTSKEINGKNGTKIYFNRSDFEVNTNEQVTLELLELYDFNEVLYRNLSTITTNNELLETNGVLYISFKSNDKKLKLKENKVLIVYPPEGKLENYNIYNLTKDSLINNKWEIYRQDYMIISENKGTSWSPIFVESLIHKDSLKPYHYTKREIEEFLKLRNNYFTIENNDFGWINIDRLVNIDYKLDFKLIDKKNQFSGFTVFFTYKNLKSFMTDIRLKNNLKFKEIPISDSTWITVIGEKDNILFYDNIELNKQLNNSEIVLKMKRTTNVELQKILSEY